MTPEWITGTYVVPAEDDYAAQFADAPAPVLRRAFAVADKPVKRAVWRIASPGMYDASVNGMRVNAVALPIWTAFDRRVLEDEYDVTALINMILGVTAKDRLYADVNTDGMINVSDVTSLINKILGV